MTNTNKIYNSITDCPCINCISYAICRTLMLQDINRRWGTYKKVYEGQLENVRYENFCVLLVDNVLITRCYDITTFTLNLLPEISYYQHRVSLAKNILNIVYEITEEIMPP